MNSILQNRIRSSRRVLHRRSAERGFSLVELLLAISIIAVLGLLAVGILRDAQEESRESATISLISQLEMVIQQRFEHYEVRKVPIRLTDYTDDRIVLRQLKQMIIVDIIRAEMPRTSSDVAASFPSAEFEAGIDRLIGQGYLTNADKLSIVAVLQDQEPALKSRFVAGQQDAEYFYGVIATSDFNDSPGTELIPKRTIANDDGDDYPELVDYWGDPLIFTIEQLEATEGDDLQWEDTGSTEALDPTTPRPLDKIQFTISSINIPN